MLKKFMAKQGLRAVFIAGSVGRSVSNMVRGWQAMGSLVGPNGRNQMTYQLGGPSKPKFLRNGIRRFTKETYTVTLINRITGEIIDDSKSFDLELLLGLMQVIQQLPNVSIIAEPNIKPHKDTDKKKNKGRDSRKAKTGAGLV